MGNEKRTALQQEVVEALLETKAINLEAIAAVFGRFGERAMLEGSALATVIDGDVIWNCGFPGPFVIPNIENHAAGEG